MYRHLLRFCLAIRITTKELGRVRPFGIWLLLVCGQDGWWLLLTLLGMGATKMVYRRPGWWILRRSVERISIDWWNLASCYSKPLNFFLQSFAQSCRPWKIIIWILLYVKWTCPLTEGERERETETERTKKNPRHNTTSQKRRKAKG